MADSIIVFVTKAPYGLEDGFAGLRYALSQIASGIIPDVSVVLMEDGVFNGMKGQRSEAVGMPSNWDAITDLTTMDVPVYVVKEDAQEMGILDRLEDELELIPRSEIAGMVAAVETAVMF